MPFAVSCGSGRPTLYDVQGSVLYQKVRPAAHALVILHPVDATGRMERVRPHGVADASGKFRLSTYMPDDGCPAGEYRVTVVWPQQLPGAEGDDEGGDSGPDQLKGKYADPETSGLTLTVQAGEPDLPPILLE